MNRIFIPVISAFILVLNAAAQAAVVRVGSGTWGDSYSDIQEAVSAANPDDEIWVKQGVYPVSSAITIDKAVSLYGGFDGTETEREARNWSRNATVIDGQDMTTCLNITADMTLDGFTVANADASPPPENPATDRPSGGGMLNQFKKVTVSNCIFKDNHADIGGGIMNMGGDLTIINCIFTGNTGAGAAIYNAIGNVRIINSTFSKNTSENGMAGAIHSYGAYGYTCSVAISNSILWGDTGGEIFTNGWGTIFASHSDIPDISGPGVIDADPLFVGGGDFHLLPGSPCIDTGTGEGFPVADIEGTARPQGWYWDMGAYECITSNLISLTATPQPGAIVLRWRTRMDITRGYNISNTGFNIYRATAQNGVYEKINTSVIAGRDHAFRVARYRFADRGLQNGTAYYYKLETINQLGDSVMHGPVQATPGWFFESSE